MLYLKCALAADLEDLETDVWVANMKRVSALYWSNTIKDVTTGDTVDITTLTDAEIADRQRFPLFGWIGGVVLNANSGYTLRWSPAIQSELDGEFYMPKPTDADVVALYDTVKASYPGISEVDIDPAEHWPVVEE